MHESCVETTEILSPARPQESEARRDLPARRHTLTSSLKRLSEDAEKLDDVLEEWKALQERGVGVKDANSDSGRLMQ